MSGSWSRDVYAKMSIRGLTLVAFYNLDKEKADFEDLLGQCFALFPTRFCFLGLPQWPDARKLDRPLRLLRQEGFIRGDPEKGFLLTDKGKRKGREIIKTLRQKKLAI